MSDDSKNLRCFCARKPLLGVVGRDSEGYYLHVKFPKGGEIIVREGRAKVLCRECLRWMQVDIRVAND